MSKNYSFEFSGTKEMFLNQLNKYPNNNQRFFYSDDYIMETSRMKFALVLHAAVILVGIGLYQQ